MYNLIFFSYLPKAGWGEVALSCIFILNNVRILCRFLCALFNWTRRTKSSDWVIMLILHEDVKKWDVLPTCSNSKYTVYSANFILLNFLSSEFRTVTKSQRYPYHLAFEAHFFRKVAAIFILHSSVHEIFAWLLFQNKTHVEIFSQIIPNLCFVMSKIFFYWIPMKWLFWRCPCS